MNRLRGHRRALTATAAVLLLAVAGFAVPTGVSGLTPAEVIGNWFATFVFWLIQLMANLLVVIINIMVAVAQYNEFLSAPAVVRGWAIVRDIANMFFIVVLLIIAFGTILRLENYRYNRLLARLVVMAILVNFSKFIAGFFIDFAQVIMLTFVNAWRDAAAGNLTTALGLQDIVSISGAGGFIPAEDANVGAILTALLLGLTLLIIAVIVMTVIAIVLILRIFALWFLVVLSPLAYLLRTYPSTERYAARWWSEFGKYVSCGPVVAFLLWLSLAIMATPNQFADQVFTEVRTEERSGIVTDLTGQTTTGTAAEISAAISVIGRSDRLLSYITGIMLLVGSLVVAKEVCGAGGQLAGQWAERIKRAGTKAATIGGAAFVGGPLAGAAVAFRKQIPAAGRQLDKLSIGLQRSGALGQRLRQRPVSLRPSFVKQAWQDSQKRREENYYRGVAGGMYDHFQAGIGGVVSGKYKTNRAFADRQAMAAKLASERKDLVNRPELILPELDQLIKPQPGGGHQVSFEDQPQFEAFLRTLVANKNTKDLLTSDVVGKVTGSREYTPENFSSFIQQTMGDTPEAIETANSVGSIAFANQQRRFAALTYLNDRRNWRMNLPENLAEDAGYHWGELQTFDPVKAGMGWDAYKVKHKENKGELQKYQEHWRDEYHSQTAGLLSTLQGGQSQNDLVRSLDTGGIFTTRGIGRDETLVERALSDEGTSNLLKNYVNVTQWPFSPKTKSEMLKKYDVIQALAMMGSSNPATQQAAKRAYQQRTGVEFTGSVTPQQQLGLLRLLAGLMNVGGRDFDKKADAYKQADGGYDRLGQVFERFAQREGYDVYGEVEQYEVDELAKREESGELYPDMPKDEQKAMLEAAKQAAVERYNTAHAADITAGRVKSLAKKPESPQPVAMQIPSPEDFDKGPTTRPVTSTGESAADRAAREARETAERMKVAGVDVDEDKLRRDLLEKYEDEEDDELTRREEEEDDDVAPLRDINRDMSARTLAKVEEYRSRQQNFFDSDEYQQNAARYLTSEQSQLTERLQGSDRNAVGGVRGLARGRRTVLINADTFAGGKYKNLAGGYLTDPKIKADFAREYVGLIDQEISTTESSLASAGTDRERTGFQKRLDALQKAKQRLSDPAGLKDLKFVNSARLGYSARHVVAHEDTHAKLDEIDSSGAFRENLRQSLNPDQLATIVRQMREKMQDESLSESDAFDEYLAEGLTNVWDSWADTGADAVKLDPSVLERVQSHAKQQGKATFMQAGPELDRFSRTGGGTTSYLQALGYRGAANAQRLASRAGDWLSQQGRILWTGSPKPGAPGSGADAASLRELGQDVAGRAKGVADYLQTGAQVAAKPFRTKDDSGKPTVVGAVTGAVGRAIRGPELGELQKTAAEKLAVRDRALAEQQRRRDDERIRKAGIASRDEVLRGQTASLVTDRDQAARSGDQGRVAQLNEKIKQIDTERETLRAEARGYERRRQTSEQDVARTDREYRKAQQEVEKRQPKSVPTTAPAPAQPTISAPRPPAAPPAPTTPTAAPTRPSVARTSTGPVAAPTAAFSPDEAVQDFEQMIRRSAEELASSLGDVSVKINDALSHIEKSDRSRAASIRERFDTVSKNVAKGAFGNQDEFELKRYLRELTNAVRESNKKKPGEAELPKPPRAASGGES